MTITHHPTEGTLIRLAAGTLAESLGLVAATHLSFCAACRERVSSLEAVGGALLESEACLAMAPDALRSALARLDEPEFAVPQRRPHAAVELPLPIPLPAPLRACDIGPWRPLAPGFAYSAIRTARRRGARVMLLRGARGRALPAHGHGDTEFTCVLAGSFSDATGRYGPGDMAEASASLDHQPVIGPEGECISLVAVEGGMRMHSFLGRLATSLLRI
jgi:putative transcriptional regulator